MFPHFVIIFSPGEPEPSSGAELVQEDSPRGRSPAADEPRGRDTRRPHPHPPPGAASLHTTVRGQRPEVRHQRG